MRSPFSRRLKLGNGFVVTLTVASFLVSGPLSVAGQPGPKIEAQLGPGLVAEAKELPGDVIADTLELAAPWIEAGAGVVDDSGDYLPDDVPTVTEVAGLPDCLLGDRVETHTTGLPEWPDPVAILEPAVPACQESCDLDGCVELDVPAVDLALPTVLTPEVDLTPNIVVDQVEVKRSATGFTVLATLTNEGGPFLTAFQSTLTIAVGQRFAIFESVVEAPPIPPGESVQLPIEFPTQESGAYTLYYKADSSNVVAESNEADNARSFDYMGPQEVDPGRIQYEFQDTNPLREYLEVGLGILNLSSPLVTSSVVSRIYAMPPSTTPVVTFRLAELETLLGPEFGSPFPYELVDGNGGPYVRFMDKAGDLTRFAPITLGASPLYTHGSTSEVLVKRSMVIHYGAAPPLRTETRVIETDAGPIVESMRFADGEFQVWFNGTDESGQRVHYNRAWLQSLGIETPDFISETGAAWTYTVEEGHYVVDSKHFSHHGIRHGSKPGWKQEGSSPWSAAGWYSSGKGYIDSDRRSDANILNTRSVGVRNTDSFHIKASWQVDRRGVGTMTFPLVLAPDIAGDLTSKPGTILFYYTNGADGTLGNYGAMYRDRASGVPLFVSVGESSLVGPEISFEVDYCNTNRQLSLSILDHGTGRAYAGFYTISTSPKDSFLFGKGGFGGGRPAGTEPPVWKRTEATVTYFSGIDPAKACASPPVTSGGSSPPAPAPPRETPPVLIFNVNPRSASGRTVTFDASRTFDREGGPLTFRVNWGDGSPVYTGAHMIQDHVFPCPTSGASGGYLISVTVTDPTGRSSSDKRGHTVKNGDTDGEGLLDCIEDELGSDLRKRDTDGDGLSDKQEYDGLLVNPKPGTTVRYKSHPAFRDSDFDGEDDTTEYYLYRTNPLKEDTDGDGAWDTVDFDPLIDAKLNLKTFRYKVTSTDKSVHDVLWTNLYGPADSNSAAAESGKYDSEPTAWRTLVGDLRDSFPLHTVTVYLEGRKASPSSDGRCHLSYSIATGTWTGDDHPSTPSDRDGDGYGHCSGPQGEFWFTLTQPGADGDNIPPRTEQTRRLTGGVTSPAIYGALDPFQNNHDGNPDADGIPNWKELQLGTDMLAKDVYAWDFTVALNWAASPEYVAQVKRGFRDANAHLWDATEGHFLMGKVTIHNGVVDPYSLLWVNADVQIYRNNPDGTLKDWYRATRDGILMPDAGSPACASIPDKCKDSHRGHIFMMESSPDEDGKAGGAPDDGVWGLILAHEMGHYAFGLWDEYQSLEYFPGSTYCPHLEIGEKKTYCDDPEPVGSTPYILCKSLGKPTMMEGQVVGSEFSAEPNWVYVGNCYRSREFQESYPDPEPDRLGVSAWRRIFDRHKADVDLSAMAATPTKFSASYHPEAGPYEASGHVITWA